MSKQKDSSTYIFVIFAFLSNVAAIVFGMLKAVGYKALFNNSIGNMTKKYFIEIIPEPIVFSITWSVLYIWTFALSVYLLAALCLPDDQSPVKFVPTLTPKLFLIGVSVSQWASVVCLFTDDRERILVSNNVVLIGLVALWHAIDVSLTVVHDNMAKIEASSTVMLWVMRILVQNGLCLFSTWTVFAAVIGFTKALVYEDSAGLDHAQLTGLVSQEDGSTIGLVLIFVFMLLLFGVQNFTNEEQFRYIFSIFPVFIISLSGTVASLNGSGSQRNLIIAGVDLGLSILFLIVRIVLSVFKFLPSRDQYYSTKSSAKIDLMSDYY